MRFNYLSFICAIVVLFFASAGGSLAGGSNHQQTSENHSHAQNTATYRGDNYPASQAATPGNSNGTCSTQGASGSGMSFGFSLYLLEAYCLISKSRADAEESCRANPVHPDIAENGYIRMDKDGTYPTVANPQCARIAGLIEQEDRALEAYAGRNNWKLKARAYTFGVLGWLF